MSAPARAGGMTPPQPAEECQRTGGVLPVAEHLRPLHPRRDDWCPLYCRLLQPADRDFWRNYDVVDYVPAANVFALPIVGEA